MNAAAATLAARLDPEQLHAGPGPFLAPPPGTLVFVPVDVKMVTVVTVGFRTGVWGRKRVFAAVGLAVDWARFEGVVLHQRTSLLAMRA